MEKKLIAAALGLALLLPGAARAAELTVTGAFSRATTGPAPGVVYFTVQGGDVPDSLRSASSPAAARVALHTASHEGGVMRMREVEAIPVPAGGTVVLQPGSLHLMLEGLRAPLRQGGTVEVVLVFERAGERRIEVPVLGPGAAAPPAR